ncbi:unnamed protein product [Cylicocyclus nassatus]|uniref:Uncharacterized protein n=1 Tax=Cylicocyclus nassatus TaxID=53992 RepID=A0AA36DNL0_CYLNA|nr:unnamed protein product [Cylicocyclus nassatus]
MVNQRGTPVASTPSTCLTKRARVLELGALGQKNEFQKNLRQRTTVLERHATESQKNHLSSGPGWRNSFPRPACTNGGALPPLKDVHVCKAIRI